MTFDHKLGLGTDSAHLLIFDPTLLDHTVDWPVGWYADPAVWQHESAKGNVLAWCTRSDGGYAVRLTTGDLTEAERPLAGASWTFALRSTGRVLIDGDYNLPGESSSGPGPDERAWIDLPEGLWHVTVTAIEWTASDLPEEEASKLFANYVATFAPAGDAPPPTRAKRPPDLICLRSEPANDTLPEPFTQSPSAQSGPDTSEPMPAGLSARVLPGRGSFTSEGESDLSMSIVPGERIFKAFRAPAFHGAQARGRGNRANLPPAWRGRRTG